MYSLNKNNHACYAQDSVVTNSVNRSINDIQLTLHSHSVSDQYVPVFLFCLHCFFLFANKVANSTDTYTFVEVSPYVEYEDANT